MREYATKVSLDEAVHCTAFIIYINEECNMHCENDIFSPALCERDYTNCMTNEQIHHYFYRHLKIMKHFLKDFHCKQMEFNNKTSSAIESNTGAIGIIENQIKLIENSIKTITDNHLKLREDFGNHQILVAESLACFQKTLEEFRCALDKVSNLYYCLDKRVKDLEVDKGAWEGAWKDLKDRMDKLEKSIDLDKLKEIVESWGRIVEDIDKMIAVAISNATHKYDTPPDEKLATFNQVMEEIRKGDEVLRQALGEEIARVERESKERDQKIHDKIDNLPAAKDWSAEINKVEVESKQRDEALGTRIDTVNTRVDATNRRIDDLPGMKDYQPEIDRVERESKARDIELRRDVDANTETGKKNTNEIKRVEDEAKIRDEASEARIITNSKEIVRVETESKLRDDELGKRIDNIPAAKDWSGEIKRVDDRAKKAESEIAASVIENEEDISRVESESKQRDRELGKRADGAASEIGRISEAVGVLDRRIVDTNEEVVKVEKESKERDDALGKRIDDIPAAKDYQPEIDRVEKESKERDNAINTRIDNIPAAKDWSEEIGKVQSIVDANKVIQDGIEKVAADGRSIAIDAKEGVNELNDRVDAISPIVNNLKPRVNKLETDVYTAQARADSAHSIATDNTEAIHGQTIRIQALEYGLEDEAAERKASDASINEKLKDAFNGIINNAGSIAKNTGEIDRVETEAKKRDELQDERFNKLSNTVTDNEIKARAREDEIIKKVDDNYTSNLSEQTRIESESKKRDADLDAKIDTVDGDVKVLATKLDSTNKEVVRVEQESKERDEALGKSINDVDTRLTDRIDKIDDGSEGGIKEVKDIIENNKKETDEKLKECSNHTDFLGREVNRVEKESKERDKGLSERIDKIDTGGTEGIEAVKKEVKRVEAESKQRDMDISKDLSELTTSAGATHRALGELTGVVSAEQTKLKTLRDDYESTNKIVNQHTTDIVRVEKESKERDKIVTTRLNDLEDDVAGAVSSVKAANELAGSALSEAKNASAAANTASNKADTAEMLANQATREAQRATTTANQAKETADKAYPKTGGLINGNVSIEGILTLGRMILEGEQINIGNAYMTLDGNIFGSVWAEFGGANNAADAVRWVNDN